MLPMLLALCLLLADPAGDIQDHLNRLKSADEAALLKALKDSDWEIVHRAADELGKRGTDAAVGALVELAVRGPIRKIRVAAARALRSLAAERASDMIARRMKGGVWCWARTRSCTWARRATAPA